MTTTTYCKTKLMCAAKVCLMYIQITVTVDNCTCTEGGLSGVVLLMSELNRWDLYHFAKCFCHKLT
jgi:hypothetical protein